MNRLLIKWHTWRRDANRAAYMRLFSSGLDDAALRKSARSAYHHNEIVQIEFLEACKHIKSK